MNIGERRRSLKHSIRALKSYRRTLGAAGVGRALFGKRPAPCEVRRPDCRFPFHLRVPSSDVETYDQVFFKREYDFAVAKPPKVIVDAGANIGLASIWFANRYPDARVIAIEPEDGNFELLQKNLAPYPNVTAIRAALWHRNEQISLLDPGQGNWGFMTEADPGAAEIEVRVRHLVPAFTVDRLMADHGLDRIDILKIDIEGAEKEVFGDTSAWLDKVDAIIAELHERKKSGCNRSFYSGSPGFRHEWLQGENVYLSRGNCLLKPG